MSGWFDRDRQPRRRDASNVHRVDDKETQGRAIYALYAKFISHLQGEGPQAILNRSMVFMGLLSETSRVNMTLELMASFGICAQMVPPVAKCASRSARIRHHGNELFRCDRDVEALQEFTKAAAHAQPNSSALVLAYGNRTAVFMRHELYAECLHDLELVKSIDPSAFTKKLQERFLKATKLLLEKKTFAIDGADTNIVPSLSERNINKKIPCASDSVEIKFLAGRGRQVVAVKDIKVGDVIAVEDPYTVVVDPRQALLHCHYCIKLCYALIPCDKCTYALYCSKDCREKAFTEYHEYECPVIDTIACVDFLDAVAVRVVIKARDEYGKIATYPSSSEKYMSNRYYEIHNLESMTDARPMMDLFMRAFYAAYYFQFFRDNTTFFKDDPNREDVFKSIMIHHMQTVPINYHTISEMVAIDNVSTSDNSLGGGLYSFQSLTNHSCVSNVIGIDYGCRRVLRAIATIPAGEELLCNYGCHYSSMEKSQRQEHLKFQYKFDCRCVACQQNYPLFTELSIHKCTLQMGVDDFMALEGARDISRSDLSRITKYAIEKVQLTERHRPSLSLFNAVEALKQCWHVSSNIRKF